MLAGSALGTQAPENNLGFVNVETMIVGWSQTGCVTRMTVRIRNAVAATTYQMMVIIAGAPFEPGGMSGRFDLPNQIGRHACRQDVIDGLLRDGTEALGNALMHLLDGGMRMADQPFKYCMTGCGDPQTVLTQFGNDGCLVSTHARSIIRHFLE